MKKVGILSMQHVQNFGSLLQAYSLKKICSEFNCQVFFIDIKKIDDDYKLTSYEIQESVFRKENVKRYDRYFVNRVRQHFKMTEQENRFDEFRNKYLYINGKIDKYDLAIIGSDEVFNFNAKSKWGFTSQLFGNIPEAKKIITYAACCGMTTTSHINSQIESTIRKYITKISDYSVRDQNTFEFLNYFVDSKKINLHLDPVLIGNFDEEMEKNQDILNRLPKKYCIVYSYGNRIKDKHEIDEIKRFCKNKRMKIITVGAPQFWAKNLVPMNPFEMLVAFKNAEFVITDTFHGTIFSSKYSKRFAVLTRESNSFKLNDLIERLNIKDHKIVSMDDLNKIYSIEKDCNKINKILNEQRKVSLKYLEKNINE